jgi:hypothetical protein
MITAAARRESGYTENKKIRHFAIRFTIVLLFFGKYGKIDENLVD